MTLLLVANQNIIDEMSTHCFGSTKLHFHSFSQQSWYNFLSFLAHILSSLKTFYIIGRAQVSKHNVNKCLQWWSQVFKTIMWNDNLVFKINKVQPRIVLPKTLSLIHVILIKEYSGQKWSPATKPKHIGLLLFLTNTSFLYKIWWFAPCQE
jgi:hypothetical protein